MDGLNMNMNNGSSSAASTTVVVESMLDQVAGRSSTSHFKSSQLTLYYPLLSQDSWSYISDCILAWLGVAFGVDYK